MNRAAFNAKKKVQESKEVSADRAARVSELLEIWVTEVSEQLTQALELFRSVRIDRLSPLSWVPHPKTRIFDEGCPSRKCT